MTLSKKIGYDSKTRDSRGNLCNRTCAEFAIYYCGLAGICLINKRLDDIENTFSDFVGYIICVYDRIIHENTGLPNESFITM